MMPPRIALDHVTAPYAALVLRLTLGIVFIAHGLFKVLVLGLSETAAFFVAHGFPEWLVYPVFVAEVLGGAALVAGFYTRVVAIALLPVLLGAFTVHWTNGWYFGNPQGGWEYIAVLVAALLVQAGLGDGAFALTPIAPNSLTTRPTEGRSAGQPLVGTGWSQRSHLESASWAVTVVTAIAATAALLAAGPARRQEPSSAASDAVTLARRYFDEVWNRGRVEVLDELLAPEYVNHTPSVGNPPPGPSGLKPIVLAMRRAFPDLRFTIEDVVVGPDAVAIRTTMTGTHEGDLFGIAPTHRRINVTQIQIERVRGGRIVEHWRVTDELTLMRQLGVVP
jgi:predicted ester cyclase/uncharacterized membrane protein YphA (DoxX/SURF4 family)